MKTLLRSMLVALIVTSLAWGHSDKKSHESTSKFKNQFAHHHEGFLDNAAPYKEHGEGSANSPRYWIFEPHSHVNIAELEAELGVGGAGRDNPPPPPRRDPEPQREPERSTPQRSEPERQSTTSTTTTQQQTQQQTANTRFVLNCDALIFGHREVCYEWDLRREYYVGIPVLPDAVETVSDLWHHIYDTTGRRLELKFYVNGGIKVYDGKESDLDGDIAISPHSGFLIASKPTIPIAGIQQHGEVITLAIRDSGHHQIHFIGFPEVPANYEIISDLVEAGVTWVETAVKQGKTIVRHRVTQAGDEGDVAITAGMGVVVRVDSDVTLDLSGASPQAPMAQRYKTLTTSWATMKMGRK